MARKYFDEIALEYLNKSDSNKLIITPKRMIQPVSELQGQHKEIHTEKRKFFKGIKKKSWQKVIKSYQDFRTKYGPEQSAKLTDILLMTQQVCMQDGTVRLGIVHNGSLINPILPKNMVKVYNLFINEAIKKFREENNTYFVPPSFSYDVNDFDKSKLEKLLDKNNYRLNEFKDARSTNVRLKSKDNIHLVNINYSIHTNEPAFTIKYVAFGFKLDNKRDKFDICYKVNFLNGHGEPVHIETDLEVQELIDETPLLDFDVLSQRARGITDSQLKVDRKTGNAFFSYKKHNELERLDHPNYVKQLTNYKLLTEKPILLGGGVFDYAVKFGLEHQKKLIEIRDYIQKTK